MKNKSYVAISLLFMAVGISFFAYSHHHAAESRNPLAMANVEALTREEIIDGGELPEVGITCSGSGSGKCYKVAWMDGLYGYCFFYCESTGIEEDNCASFWVDFVNLCTYFGGFNGIGDHAM